MVMNRYVSKAVYLLFLSLVFVGYSSAVSAQVRNQLYLYYIEDYKDIAMEQQQKYKIRPVLPWRRGCWSRSREGSAGPQVEQPLRHQMPRLERPGRLSRRRRGGRMFPQIPSCRRVVRRPLEVFDRPFPLCLSLRIAHHRLQGVGPGVATVRLRHRQGLCQQTDQDY